MMTAGQQDRDHEPERRDKASKDLFEATSFLYGANTGFIEELYERFLSDPQAVNADWREYFTSLAETDAQIVPRPAREGAPWARTDWPVLANGELVSALDLNWPAAEQIVRSTIADHATAKGAPLSDDALVAAARDSICAVQLIRTYRVRGHLAADLDPLHLRAPMELRELEPSSFGFEEADYDRPIFLNNMLGFEKASIRQILEAVQRIYCGAIGIEYMHISDLEERGWLQQRFESRGSEVAFTPEGKKAILQKLIEAESFEKFLGVKYTGTKRFGLDGAETMVPAMEQIIKRGGHLGVCEIVFGMPHRGRLNMLANVMAKPYRAIFHEFKGGSSHPSEVEGSGDVKYHLGASSDREFDGNKVHLSLTANPSHLEAVDPVVLGKVRAKQFQLGDTTRSQVLPVLLHGDAAFAGQGVVAECFGLSGLKGHRTGGTIHFIVNNQIGFTTSPIHARSSPYPSDVAKAVQAPILHVNGDDPEAVVHATKIAVEFRQKFHKDVVIDMFCYRRFGHNEGDEPKFTQPIMYDRIHHHPTVVKIYSDKLIGEGVITAEDYDGWTEDFRSKLEEEMSQTENYLPNKADWLDGRWAGFSLPGEGDRRGETAVDLDILKRIGTRLSYIPDTVKAHKTVQRLMENRGEMIKSGHGVDWAMGEALAFGSLLLEGYPVRLSGQDCSRGTFSQRHSTIVDQESEERYIPLNDLNEEQVPFEVVDSMLSEMAVLGFEYGYSLAEPRALVLWEAQFGDFANGAQVIIDQFIASGERKWLRMSGLVMLLPHGYEGQGPEHSSARLERYLQACAEDNIQVANCSTPANYFHILRRQLHRNFRKPLIIMTPKSLLRHKRCLSRLEDMGPGSSFHRVLNDDAERYPDQSAVKLVGDKNIRRVVLCSGKVYFDLYEARESRGINDIQILRLEQLYPFPAKSLLTELGRFKDAEMIWCQEEPKNMGAWTFIEPNLEWVLQHIEAKHRRPRYAGRDGSASTASGLMSRHIKERDAFVNEALTL
jgi:2-oxoglutarate dehydrogenase E1 component